jgi:hypothetical protein
VYAYLRDKVAGRIPENGMLRYGEAAAFNSR